MSGFNLKGFEGFEREVSKGIKKTVSSGAASGAGGGGNPMDNLFKQIAARYLAFIRRRFVKFSRGGGDWKDLARSTKLARRHKFKKKGRRRSKHLIGKTLELGRFAILRDTSTMFNALSLGSPGNLYKKIRHGIRVGFGGPARHVGGKATIADIAGFHNKGKGKLPKRRIIVEPDASLHEKIKRDLHRALNKVASNHDMK